MRARLAIRYAGAQVHLREVVLRSKPAELLAISPKGTVPVLLRPDGAVLEQSLDIMRWACSQADPDHWLPASMTEQGLAWLSINDGPFKQWLDRYKYPERHADQPAEHHRDQGVEIMLAPMNQQLEKTPFLFGDSPCLVDMALMPFVRQFAQVDAAWFAQAPLPGLQRWLAVLLASPLLEQVMGKYEPWQPGQPDMLF
jgi:glutathione S-transferase